MIISVLCVGKNMPDWVITACQEYQQRLPADYQVRLIEIPAEKRFKQADLKKISEKEEQKILAAIPKNALSIALDRIGKTIDTKKLANTLRSWHDVSQDICIVIGGPEGLSQQFLKRANEVWSISALTLPHPRVRVIIAEQIFRAWSIIVNHPYHR